MLITYRNQPPDPQPFLSLSYLYYAIDRGKDLENGSHISVIAITC